MAVHPPEIHSLTTSDGVRLDADVYYPKAKGKFPVLLMRQPYGRAIASTVVYAHPSWYASQGYIVVIQDVRGRGTSEGDFQVFRHETSDGAETVDWAANLPRSNGKVGMYGFSYQAMTQLYAAMTQPPALKTIIPAMMGVDLYADWAYEGGAFCLQNNLGWAIQLGAETARLRSNTSAYNALYAASRNLPLHDPIPALPEVMNQYAEDSFYHDWLQYDTPGSYWERLSPDLRDVDLPMLHIGGWFDPFLRGNWRLYQEMAARSQHPQHLYIAPWGHLPWGRKVGEKDYGAAANSSIDSLQIQWFNHFLKDEPKGTPYALPENPVTLFELGSNTWKNLSKLPTPPKFSHQPVDLSKVASAETLETQVYFLATNGLAAIQENAGKLVLKPEPETNQDIFVHDPWRPVPSLGGHAGNAGQCDRSSLDCRTDVLTYTTAPLTADLSLLGVITVELFATASTPSFDLSATLSEVDRQGRVYNFTQSYLRIDDPEDLPLTITLQPSCVQLPAGHSLRLSISGACFPAYPVNDGTGKPIANSHLIDQQIITITLSSGGNSPSRILLPRL
ncbi:MAG: CocE/NonD family hydrolase [Coleofasciculaceae cyanobacterium SM2_1_6]|nr:CocE/NonD family hydrolase [Coleofasciculaceae cyanobacterium SM2_1_6]